MGSKPEPGTCKVKTNSNIHTLYDTSILINRYIIWGWITLEAYFHSDPRIVEWVDQIIEKIFTVCQLTGVGSEVEFERGCQIVTKITQLLQEISILPSEYLEDGLKQLLEQQFPDSQVINKYPKFQDTMNKMLRKGMTSAIGTQNDENLRNLIFSKKNTLENTKEDAREIYMAHCDESTGSPVNAFNDEFVAEGVITDLASVSSTSTNFWEAGVELQVSELDELMATTNDSSSVIASSLVPSISTKTYGIIRKTHVPEQADRLKHVLSNIFPNVSVCWNLKLMGQTFLAQVEDILIYLQNPEQPCHVEKLNKEGWKVYECSSDDLMFPRRLEREIRRIQRLGKQCKIG